MTAVATKAASRVAKPKTEDKPMSSKSLVSLSTSDVSDNPMEKAVLAVAKIWATAATIMMTKTTGWRTLSTNVFLAIVAVWTSMRVPGQPEQE